MSANDAFGDLSTAARMRDAIQKLVRQTLRTERPDDVYAIVQSINRPTKTAVVRFAGETTDITLPMGAIQPSANGAAVRVVGSATDRRIDQPSGVASASFLYCTSGTITNTLNVNGDFAGVAARLSRTNAPTLGGIFHGLEIGTAGNTAGQIGMMFGPAAIQTKSGSAASTMDLNPGGGAVRANAYPVVSLRGRGGHDVGSAPPAVTATDPKFIMQAGQELISFSAGVGTLTFPVAFPNGILFVLCGGRNTGGDVITQSSTGSHTLSAVTLSANYGGAGITGSQYVCWFAIGY